MKQRPSWLQRERVNPPGSAHVIFCKLVCICATRGCPRTCSLRKSRPAESSGNKTLVHLTIVVARVDPVNKLASKKNSYLMHIAALWHDELLTIASSTHQHSHSIYRSHFPYPLAMYRKYHGVYFESEHECPGIITVMTSQHNCLDHLILWPRQE